MGGFRKHKSIVIYLRLLKPFLIKHPLIIYVFIASLALFWIPEGKIAYFHDENIPLNPLVSFKEYLYIWRESINFGFATSGGVQKLIPFSIFAIADILNIGIRSVEIFLYCLILFGSGYFSFLLFKSLKLISSEERNTELGIISSLFYIFSPFAIFYVWRPNYIITRGWFYVFAPLLLYAIYRYCGRKANKSDTSALFLIVLSGILITPAFSHPSFPFILVLLIALLFFILVIDQKVAVKRLIYDHIKIGLILLFINAYWLLPRIYTAQSELQGAASVGLRPSLINNSSNLSLENNFLLTSLPPLFEPTMWYTWQNYYVSPVFLAFTLILAVVLFSSVFRPTKKILAFLAAYLMFLPLMIGLNEPLGGFNSYIFDNFKFIQSFRDPGKWGFFLIFPMSILLGYGYTRLINKFHKYKYLLFTTFVLSVIALGWPIMVGKVLPKKYEFPSSLITVPVDYPEVSKLLANNNAQPILQLPLHGVHNYADWGQNNGYKGIDILRMMSAQPLMFYYQDPRVNELLKTLEFNIKNGDLTDENLKQLMDNINSHMIVVNLDSDNKYVKSNVSAEEYTKLLSTYDFLKKIYESDKLVLFERKEKKVSTFTVTNSLVKFDDIESNREDLKLKPNWLLAKHLGGTLNNNTEIINIKKSYNKVEQTYTYIKNEEKLSLDTAKYQYIKVAVDAAPEEVGVYVAADTDTGQSGFLETLNRPKPNSFNTNIYEYYFATTSLNNQIETLRISFISKKPFSDIDVNISSIEAVDSLFNDYGRLVGTDINAKTYSDYDSIVLASKPQILTSSKLNPAKHKLEIDTDRGLVLTLKQSYDPGWTIKTTNPKSAANYNIRHFKSNGFYNSWLIEPVNENNSSNSVEEFEIYYGPQRYFIYGLAISTLFLIVALIYAIIIFIKNGSKLKDMLHD